MNDSGKKKLAIIFLAMSTLAQIVLLTFVWNPDKFRDNVNKFKQAVHDYKNRFKSAVKKDQPPAPDP